MTTSESRTSAGSIESSAMPQIESEKIQLRGVRVHNLKNIDVDIPLNQLTVITGVSGSGKSSLAFDTLYVEGQRRYVDSFSASTRQHLERLQKPDVDEVNRIPPAIAIRQFSRPASTRLTLAATTEIQHYLEQLFLRLGTLHCPACGVPVTPNEPSQVVDEINSMPAGTRLQMAFPVLTMSDGLALSNDEGDAKLTDKAAWESEVFDELSQRGFSRALLIRSTQGDSPQPVQTGELVELTNLSKGLEADDVTTVLVIVDRIAIGRTDESRLLESVEVCLASEAQRCILLAPVESADDQQSLVQIGEQVWQLKSFPADWSCSQCDRKFRAPTQQDLSASSQPGQCPHCRGAGTISTLSESQLIPDPSRSISDGAFAVFADDKWKRDRERFEAFANDEGIRLDVSISKLSEDDVELLIHGTGSHSSKPFGVRQFLDKLDRRAKSHELTEFLALWQSIDACAECQGTRLGEIARSMRLIAAGEGAEAEADSVINISLVELADCSISQTAELLALLLQLLSNEQQERTRFLFAELDQRLRQLDRLGLSYLQLGRSIRSLASGEARRVELANALCSALVHSLFVIDEPSACLHPDDLEPVVAALVELRDLGNTVVIVDHDLRLIEIADHCIDVGLNGGQDGGQIVFAGSQDELLQHETSLTAKTLRDQRDDSDITKSATTTTSRVNESTSWITLNHAKFVHLDVDEVQFPLDCLCVVSGVSGSGKSSLVEHVLFPALCETFSKPCRIHERGTWQRMTRPPFFDEVLLVDDTPLTRSLRSNAATWLDIFPLIRTLYAETQEAKDRSFTAGHFSFNSDRGGRCEECSGAGQLEIDMQFLADVVMTCPECLGSRYKPDVLEVTWRHRSIAEVLKMTAAEAFAFFRGQPKIQRRLQALKEVGLEYLSLGQPLGTLSGGEAQRMKLAASLGTTKKRSLLLLNEPSRGLHPFDVNRLVECFDRLLTAGHSLIVIDNDPAILAAADYQIRMGPGAGPAGGHVVFAG